MTYTAPDGTCWDCRQEYRIAEQNIARQRREAARVAKYGAEAVALAKAEHAALVEAQRQAIEAAIAANPPIGQPGHRSRRNIAISVCAEFRARLMISSMRPELCGE